MSERISKTVPVNLKKREEHRKKWNYKLVKMREEN